VKLRQALVDRPGAQLPLGDEPLTVGVDVLRRDRVEWRVATELGEQVAVELAAIPADGGRSTLAIVADVGKPGLGAMPKVTAEPGFAPIRISGSIPERMCWSLASAWARVK
jgi:hypothetical protein